ncbi:hypothetical protein JW926_01415 [Candidatus Sumerlaeota bacterium]|nr:hypothetical protein [Candidatus Sumerlaeota bacterium]
MVIIKKLCSILILFISFIHFFSFQTRGEEELENLCLSLQYPEQYEQSLLKLKAIYKNADDQSTKDEIENIFFDLLKTASPEASLKILYFLSTEKSPDERIKKGLLSLLDKSDDKGTELYCREKTYSFR